MKRSRIHTKLWRTGFAWLLLILITGCTSLQPEQTAVVTSTPVATQDILLLRGRGMGDTLRLVYWQTATMLNPHLSASLKDFIATRITYEPLASFNKDGELVPFLASEIPSLENGGVAADGKSVTWHLRDDVQWCDGEPFTAQDVLFTYEFITNPDIKSFSANTYAAIDHVEVKDDTTLTVHFQKPNPSWAIPFVGRTGMIIPHHLFEPYNGANAQDAPNNMHPVGTGPYCFVSSNPQETLFLGDDLVRTNKMVYEPNPYFRELDKPYFRRIELKSGGSFEAAIQAVFEEESADYAISIQQFNADDMTQREQQGKGKILTNFGPKVVRIDINHLDPVSKQQGNKEPHPFFSDPLVREAFATAIDREAIAALYAPAAKVTSNILVDPSSYNSPNTSFTFDLEKAAALLDHAGWKDSDGDGIRDKDGKKLVIQYKAVVDTLVQKTQDLIKKNLATIGVEMSIDPIDSSVYFGGDTTHDDHVSRFYADVQSYAFTSNSPDPFTYMSMFTCNSPFNLTGWCNDQYDALNEQAASELDPKKRIQLFIQMNDLVVNEYVVVPLLYQADVSAASTSLEGIDLTPWDVDVWNIKDWRRRVQ